MNPEERAYKILQDSNFVKYPQDEGKVEKFLESAKGCIWEFPIDKIQERQFETSLKGWFKQFTAELIEFAKNNSSTLKKINDELIHKRLHTMDDQGFEGQVISKKKFSRNIDELIDTQSDLLCDFDDHDVFQCTQQAKMIQLGYVMDFDYQWHKKSDIPQDMEIMLDYVDWIHIHNSPKCNKVKEFYENED